MGPCGPGRPCVERTHPSVRSRRKSSRGGTVRGQPSVPRAGRQQHLHLSAALPGKFRNALSYSVGAGAPAGVGDLRASPAPMPRVPLARKRPRHICSAFLLLTYSSRRR